jgi:hypothetical protein
MFTLKFMEGGNSTVVSGARYDTHYLLTGDLARAAACIVTVYPQLTSDTAGVEFHVGGERQQYGVCYIENQSGKTIDRIGPFEAEAVAKAA